MVSERRLLRQLPQPCACLNPCCSGRWSRSSLKYIEVQSETIVLILVVVEDGLGGRRAFTQEEINEVVLILVVVEDGLGVLIIEPLEEMVSTCLNPCCSGRWSRRVKKFSIERVVFTS